MDDVWFLVSLMVSLLFLFLYYFVRKRICAARQLVIGQTQTANVEVVTVNQNTSNLRVNENANGIAFIQLPPDNHVTQPPDDLPSVPSYASCISKENDHPPSYEIATALATG